MHAVYGLIDYLAVMQQIWNHRKNNCGAYVECLPKSRCLRVDWLTLCQRMCKTDACVEYVF